MYLSGMAGSPGVASPENVAKDEGFGPFSRSQSLLLLLGATLAAVGLVLWGVLAQWPSSEWLAIVGVAISVAGFTVAILEIRSTRGKTEATAHAVKKTLRSVAAGRLAVAITQLRQLVIDLEDTVDHDDDVGARRALNAWRYQATDVASLVQRRFGEHPSLRPLTRSIRLASDAKGSLNEQSVKEATADCLEAMDKAADAVGPLLEQIQPTMEEIDE